VVVAMVLVLAPLRSVAAVKAAVERSVVVETEVEPVEGITPPSPPRQSATATAESSAASARGETRRFPDNAVPPPSPALLFGDKSLPFALHVVAAVLPREDGCAVVLGAGNEALCAIGGGTKMAGGRARSKEV
jgi:hypothetical protein